MTATLETPPSVPTAARTTAAPQPLHLRTDDPDEVRVWTTRDSGWHSRVVHQRGPLGFELTASGGDIVSVAWARLALEQTMRGSTRKLCLHVPRAGASRYSFGRDRHEVGPGQAIVLPRDWEHTRRREQLALAALAIDSDAWQRELRARHPDLGPEDPLHPRVLELGAPEQAPLGRAIDELLAVAANPADPATTAAQRALAEAAFVDTLADALRRATAWVHVPTIAAQRLADLEQWIDAHLHEPITLGSLCKVARIGGRSLQFAFVARRGMSPMRFVTERRLHAGRRELEGIDHRASVSEVALGCGFAHLGRFAVQYRETFGESPSQTRARARCG